MASALITPVILCGGAGSRLWPLSRPGAPKPVLSLVGARSMLGLTLDRLAGRDMFAPPLVVAGAEHERQIVRIVSDVAADARYLIEPFGRDTAPAIAAAAHALPSDSLMLVLPADHVIRDTDGFRATVAAGASLARSGQIVVFGLRPGGPSIAYGYIEPGEAIGGGRRVVRFREKPDEQAARRLVGAGCLWNTGMFLMRPDVLLAEAAAHAPEIAAAVTESLPADVDATFVRIAADGFDACPAGSMDYAIMEHTDRAAVVEARFDWTDVGTWSAVHNAAPHDLSGNVVRGDATVIETQDSFIVTERPKIGVVGVSDVVVVASDEAVLVTTRERADSVKDLVAAMENEPERVIGDFIRHIRPWGHYQTLDLGEAYQVKRLYVHPGRRLSLQKHRHRSEHWTVVAGRAAVTVDNRVSVLTPNQSIGIPLGAVHRLGAEGDEPLIVIEVQHGDYLGEDDIIRLEDDFGRVATGVDPPGAG